MSKMVRTLKDDLLGSGVKGRYYSTIDLSGKIQYYTILDIGCIGLNPTLTRRCYDPLSGKEIKHESKRHSYLIYHFLDTRVPRSRLKPKRR